MSYIYTPTSLSVHRMFLCRRVCAEFVGDQINAGLYCFSKDILDRIQVLLVIGVYVSDFLLQTPGCAWVSFSNSKMLPVTPDTPAHSKFALPAALGIIHN